MCWTCLLWLFWTKISVSFARLRLSSSTDSINFLWFKCRCHTKLQTWFWVVCKLKLHRHCDLQNLCPASSITSLFWPRSRHLSFSFQDKPPPSPKSYARPKNVLKNFLNKKPAKKPEVCSVTCFIQSFLSWSPADTLLESGADPRKGRFGRSPP